MASGSCDTCCPSLVCVLGRRKTRASQWLPLTLYPLYMSATRHMLVRIAVTIHVDLVPYIVLLYVVTCTYIHVHLLLQYTLSVDSVHTCTSIITVYIVCRLCTYMYIYYYSIHCLCLFMQSAIGRRTGVCGCSPHTGMWKDRDEAMNFMQKHDIEIIKDEKRCTCSLSTVEWVRPHPTQPTPKPSTPTQTHTPTHTHLPAPFSFIHLTTERSWKLKLAFRSMI